MRMRTIGFTKKLAQRFLDLSCLLCREDQPHQCHRRLVAELLRERWGDVGVVHLGKER